MYPSPSAISSPLNIQMGEREPEQDEEEEEEAIRQRSLAENKYKNSDLKSALKHAKKAHSICPTAEGASSMLTAFGVLLAAATPDWYKILQVEPFSHFNAIKKQYRRLALILHPDKNPYAGCEEAFKLVGEGFQLFSDRVRRKEYDTKLRLRILEERVTGLDECQPREVHTFWTACSRCRLLHKFERKYLGHDLVCPNCKKNFRAVEVDQGFVGEESRKQDCGSRTRSGRLNPVNVDTMEKTSNKMGNAELLRKEGNEQAKDGGGLRASGSRGRMSTVNDVLAKSKVRRLEENGDMKESPKSKKSKISEEMMTLAQLQLKLKQKSRCEKEKSNLQQNGNLQKNKNSKGCGNPKSGIEITKQKDRENGTDHEIEVKPFKFVYQRKKTNLRTSQVASKRKKKIMIVKDFDFYDFNKDRLERNFKKGQVWAIYDDDGMPRRYGLIDGVISLNPFVMNVSWLDLLNSGGESMVCREKVGTHICCGKFRVATKSSANSVSIFSHIVESERAAKEVYRVYPKKGSVWALYNEETPSKSGNIISYDIVVVLTTYSDIYGLSMAYLEKIDGFESIFKRQKIGCHAVRWLEKVDFSLFSHQIPARKISADDVPDVSQDCWELDPASLPGDLLATGWRDD